MVTSARLLDDAYRTEKDDDVDVRERLLLVRRVLVDNEEETELAQLRKNSIDRDSRWAYKWLKRFDESGLDGWIKRPTKER